MNKQINSLITGGIILYLIFVILIYFFFFYARDFEIFFLNKSKHDIEELTFHLTGQRDTISIKNNKASDVFILKDNYSWAMIFAEPLLSMHVIKYKDKNNNAVNHTFGSVLGRTSLKRGEINQIEITMDSINQSFRFMISD